MDCDRDMIRKQLQAMKLCEICEIEARCPTEAVLVKPNGIVQDE